MVVKATTTMGKIQQLPVRRRCTAAETLANFLAARFARIIEDCNSRMARRWWKMQGAKRLQC